MLSLFLIPALNGSITGIKNNDNITATYTTSADITSPVGTYPIAPVWSDPDTRLGNYAVTTNFGTLTVTQATMQVLISSASRLYGETNPPFSGLIVGIKNSDNITASYATTATTNSLVGTYPIYPVFSDPDNKLPNYSPVVSTGI